MHGLQGILLSTQLSLWQGELPPVTYMPWNQRDERWAKTLDYVAASEPLVQFATRAFSFQHGHTDHMGVGVRFQGWRSGIQVAAAKPRVRSARPARGQRQQWQSQCRSTMLSAHRPSLLYASHAIQFMHDTLSLAAASWSEPRWGHKRIWSDKLAALIDDKRRLERKRRHFHVR